MQQQTTVQRMSMTDGGPVPALALLATASPAASAAAGEAGPLLPLLSFGIGIVAVGLCAWCLVWALRRATAGFAETGTAFFAALARHDAAMVRGLLSDGFLASVPEPALQVWLARAGLSEGGQARWINRRLTRGKGMLSGQVAPPRGPPVLVRVGLVKQQRQWRIHSLHQSRGVLDALMTRTPPRYPGVFP